MTVTTNTYREQRHHNTTAVSTIDRRVSLHNTSPLTSMLHEVDVRESPDDQFALFHGMGHYAITRPHAVYSATDTQRQTWRSLCYVITYVLSKQPLLLHQQNTMTRQHYRLFRVLKRPRSFEFVAKCVAKIQRSKISNLWRFKTLIWQWPSYYTAKTNLIKSNILYTNGFAYIYFINYMSLKCRCWPMFTAGSELTFSVTATVQSDRPCTE